MVSLRVRALFAVAVLGLLGLVCGRAEAAPGLMVGATEDMFKLQPEVAGAYARDLGLRGTRISLRWQSGQTTVAPGDVAQLRGSLTSGVRIILSVYATGDAMPQDDAAETRTARSSVTRSPRCRRSTTSSSGTSRTSRIFWRPSSPRTA